MKVPVTLMLDSCLRDRLDALAAQDERSRSALAAAARCARLLCDLCEPHPSPDSAPSTVRPAALACEASAPAGDVPLSAPPAHLAYPGRLHLDALHRSAGVLDERAAVARQHRERVVRETTEALANGATK